jgi:hypothetical protein
MLTGGQSTHTYAPDGHTFGGNTSISAGNMLAVMENMFASQRK